MNRMTTATLGRQGTPKRVVFSGREERRPAEGDFRPGKTREVAGTTSATEARQTGKTATQKRKWELKIGYNTKIALARCPRYLEGEVEGGVKVLRTEKADSSTPR